MMTKFIQVVTVGEDSKMMGKEVACINTDGEEYVDYSLYLKQYITNLTKS